MAYLVFNIHYCNETKGSCKLSIMTVIVDQVQLLAKTVLAGPVDCLTTSKIGPSAITGKYILII